MQFLTWPRFSSLEALDVSESDLGPQPVASLARLLPGLASLRQLNLSHINLAELTPAAFPLLASHLATLSLAQTRLRVNHIEALLQSINLKR